MLEILMLENLHRVSKSPDDEFGVLKTATLKTGGPPMRVLPLMLLHKGYEPSSLELNQEEGVLEK